MNHVVRNFWRRILNFCTFIEYRNISLSKKYLANTRADEYTDSIQKFHIYLKSWYNKIVITRYNIVVHGRYCIEKYFEYGRKRINCYASIDFTYILFLPPRVFWAHDFGNFMENRGWFLEIRGWAWGYDGSRLVEYGNGNIK